MRGPLCSCTGCNAWEMVDGAGAMATHRHGERKHPSGNGCRDDMCAGCLLCIPLAAGGRQVIDYSEIGQRNQSLHRVAAWFDPRSCIDCAACNGIGQ